MNLVTKLLLPTFLLTVCSLFGQTSNSQNKFDSSFTLTKHIRQDKLDIGQHGVFFNEKTKQLLKDFNNIETLSLINTANYQKQVTMDNNPLIKIWTAKNPSEKVSKVIEINSKYFIDTTEDNEQRFKDTITYNNYFIQLKDTTKNIQYETIKNQGISKYSIGDRQVFVKREMMLAGLFYIDNNKEVKQLLNKYNYAQQVWQ